MSDVNSYLLKWDFGRLEEQIKSSTDACTELGTALQGMIGRSVADLTKLQQQVSAVSAPLGSITPQISDSTRGINEAGSSIRSLMESILQNSARITAEVQKAALVGNAPGGPALERAKVQLEILLEGAAFAGAMVDVVKTDASYLVRIIKRESRKAEEDANAISNYVKKEMESTTAAMKGLLDKASIGTTSSGGIFSAMFAMMALGYTEADRKDYQKGEMVNVIEATGESLDSEASKKVVDWFDAFQEKAQWFYGISREQTQGVLKAMVEAGYRSKAILKSFNKNLGDVGSDVGMASIAMDAHFNQSVGTSISNIVNITTNFGGSLQVAADKYMKLAMAGQRSGMGISNFVNAVMAGASAMKQYGIDVEDVANVMLKIRNHYKGMGLSSQYAGTQAASVTAGLAQFISNMDMGLKATIAEKVLPGYRGLDAIQAFDEGFRRVASGKNQDFFKKALIALRNESVGGGRSRAESIYLLKSFGMDSMDATALYDVASALLKGNALTDESNKQVKAFKDSFKTEEEKISDLAKTTRNLTDAIAKIGGGLLDILSNLVALMIVVIKSVPMWVESAMPNSTVTKDDLRKSSDFIDKVVAGMGSGVSKASQGVSDFLVGIGKEADNSFGRPIMEALRLQLANPSGGMGAITSVEKAEEAWEDIKRLNQVFESSTQESLNDMGSKMMADFLLWLRKPDPEDERSDSDKRYYGGAMTSDRYKELEREVEAYKSQVDKRAAKRAAERYGWDSGYENFQFETPNLMIPAASVSQASNAAKSAQSTKN